MKPLSHVLLVSGLLLITTAASAQSRQLLARPLPNKDCLQISQVRSWYVVDDRTAIVQTGPYQRYELKTQAQCSKLGLGSPGLQLTPSPAGMATAPNNMCGASGERVSAQYQPPCAIQSLSLIDQKQFDALKAKAIQRSKQASTPVPSN